MTKYRILLSHIFLLLAFVSLSSAQQTDEYYYAIEQNGVICGYAHVLVTPTAIDGRSCTQVLDSIWVKMSALGKSFEGAFWFEFRLDPADGMYYYHTSAIDQGGMKLDSKMEVRGDSMFIVVTEPEIDTSVVFLPPGTIRQNTRIHKYLIDFFVNDTLTQKECRVYSEVDGTINTVVYTNRGREKMELAGKSYDALALESLDRTTGIQVKFWVDAVSGLLLKMLHPARNVYLADASIKEQVKRGDLDDNLLARTNKMISNPMDISFMQVQARLKPGGIWLTPEGLNVPGQKFDGTVKDNQIDGIFEISHARYNGTGAPAFPSDLSGVDSLRPYLQATDLIESDNATLIRKAQEITAGATNAWEAATRLSRWVYKEIGYDIPGGVTALKTYETKLGECGSHANLLAAFCRAVGIPARCVFGCMYTPQSGGMFGQHAWNEIYMGDAGWIPVDCTVEEVTYADCGHIRLGEWVSKAMMLNAEKMDILDYQVASQPGGGKDQSALQARYDPYVGKYQAERDVLTVLVHEGSLGFEIPGRNMIFGLKDPDENGVWLFKLTEAASVTFEKDSLGKAISMTIHERQRMPKKPAGDSAAAADVPDEYRSFVGTYTIPMQNASFDVSSQNGQLMLGLPGNRTIELARSETEDQWLGELSPGTKLAISFDTDETSQVSVMRFIKMTRCPRIGTSVSE
jgi:Transglutaminase-like superfamily